MDIEEKKDLNLIKTGRNSSLFILTNDHLNIVIGMHTQFYVWCDQPINSAVIQFFSYVRTYRQMRKWTIFQSFIHLAL